MKVLVRGADAQIKEFRSKFGQKAGIEFEMEYQESREMDDLDVIFDFLIDESPEYLEQYRDKNNLIVFCNSVKTSLAEFSFYLDHSFKFSMIGFNGMPTFIDNELLEITILDPDDEEKVKMVCGDLGTDFVIVEDRVGMVRPRVICMIINEAYYTLQEGTADKESIDLAMKLGTNYPYGPFEWASVIGVRNVYELLEAVYEDTKDERYKICPVLKREYMLG